MVHLAQMPLLSLRGDQPPLVAKGLLNAFSNLVLTLRPGEGPIEIVAVASDLITRALPRKCSYTGQSVCSAAFSVSDLESNRLAGIKPLPYPTVGLSSIVLGGRWPGQYRPSRLVTSLFSQPLAGGRVLSRTEPL
jgi:hypothetical protein